MADQSLSLQTNIIKPKVNRLVKVKAEECVQRERGICYTQ